MKLKISSSIYHFRDRALKTFGMEEWQGIDDPDKDILFFGLYHERDYQVFSDLNVKKTILWAGSDILRLVQDYERKRVINNFPDTVHYCENEEEEKNLKSVGINPIIIPSFLDDVNKYPVSFNNITIKTPKVWMCVHKDREDEYGVPLARRMAGYYPDMEFHIYGIDRPEYETLKNMIYHGYVKEEILNEEIKEYHCGFRPNFHDGNSEVAMKSILLGQYPITRIKYEGIWNYKDERSLRDLFDKLPTMVVFNQERENWIKKINNFPWVKK